MRTRSYFSTIKSRRRTVIYRRRYAPESHRRCKRRVVKRQTVVTIQQVAQKLCQISTGDGRDVASCVEDSGWFA